MAKIIAALNKRGNQPFDIKTVTYEEMIAIPNDESELVPVPVYINMEETIRVDTSISASDIGLKDERKLSRETLRHIFRGETLKAEELIFRMARERKWDKDF